MFNPYRLYRIREMRTTEELANALQADYGQTLCQGFRLRNILWLNNSLTSDPGHFWEYAVFGPDYDLPAPGQVGQCTLQQLESITVNTPSREELIALIEKMPEYIVRPLYMDYYTTVMIDRRRDHRCPLCE